MSDLSLQLQQATGQLPVSCYFDEALYLELNPDLANAGIDLRKHYLLIGQGEKRRYRRIDIADAIASPRLVLGRIRRQSFLRKF